MCLLDGLSNAEVAQWKSSGANTEKEKQRGGQNLNENNLLVRNCKPLLQTEIAKRILLHMGSRISTFW